jgi:hypothetical protein
LIYQELGFRAGYEHIGRDLKIQAVKLPMAECIWKGFPGFEPVEGILK